MNSKIIILLVFFTIALFSSCFLIDECDGVVTDQLLNFGEHQIRINTPSDTLKIGDSIRFRIKTPKSIIDSSSSNFFEIEQIEIGFYVTRDTDEPKGTPLIEVFEEYFDIIVNEGEMINPYLFNLDEKSLDYQLDFYYVCKKQLKYYIPIRFKNVIVSNVETECMNGDTKTWSGKISLDSEHNTYDNQGELENYFGFIVK